MAIVEFYFKQNQSWDMGPACGDVTTSSVNPAPVTTACIYIIHNKTENTTYVGYADNANHRWNGRTEVFHTFGIPKSYGKKILCAYCRPSVDSGKSMFLEGQNNCEHLLVRAVVNGLLGVTTNTNTQLSGAFFSNKIATELRVYLPSDPWGCLAGRQRVYLNGPY